MSDRKERWAPVWAAMQELGAALDAAGDLPDWAIAISAAIEDAQDAAEELALAEEAPDAG